jgi:hypothetical protein
MTRSTIPCILLLSLLVPAVARAQDAGDDAPWYERVRFGGDYRSRYVGFSRVGSEARNRTRLRLRLRLDAAVTYVVRFQAQRASGDAGTPVSTNQTFTGFFAPKALNLDRAFLAYEPVAAPGLTLGLGKFGMPQRRTQMVFDDDLNVEGGWEYFGWDAVGGRVEVSALQAAVNEVSGGSDAYLLGAAAEVTWPAGRHLLSVSVADYHWGNADQIALAQDGGPLEAILTNAVRRGAGGEALGFQSRFNVVDVIAEVRLDTGREGYPLRLLVDVARNTRAASDRDGGLWIEAAYGDPDARGTWGASYTFGRIEQDVTPSAFVFSDMPGTNLTLHMIDGSVMVLPGVSIDVTLHVSRRLDTFGGGAEPWLSRLHAGVVARF